MRGVRALTVGLLLVLITAGKSVQAQQSQSRSGFWFSVGLGTGSLGCDGCSDRVSALSGNLALGGTISQNVSLGVMTNGWTKSEGGVTLTAGTLTLAARLYTSKKGGFFILTGLGVSSLSLGVYGYGQGHETGTGAVVGVGYDFRVGKNVSITPFYNGFAGKFDSGDFNVGQIGAGITVH
ncbi:MAG: hypothetical protein ABIS00_10955 [Gemmatimonadales bacterium]